MSHLNVEIKARCRDAQAVRAVLRSRGADFRGTDRQVDTYFRCPRGRLKLRRGNIETALIHYDRPNKAGLREAIVTLYRLRDGAAELQEALSAALGVKAVVVKSREIYFIGNVKFHIDRVDELGDFVEIEAIDETGAIGRETLRRQCEDYLALLGIRRRDLLARSYSDMLGA